MDNLDMYRALYHVTKSELEKAKKTIRGYRITLRIFTVVMAVMSFTIGSLIAHIQNAPAEVVIVTQTETATPAAVAVSEEPAEQVTTPAPTAPPVFYELTDEQRTLIEEVVSAESRG